MPKSGLVMAPTIPLHSRSLNHVLSASRWVLNTAAHHATVSAITPHTATVKPSDSRAREGHRSPESKRPGLVKLATSSGNNDPLTMATIAQFDHFLIACFASIVGRAA